MLYLCALSSFPLSEKKPKNSCLTAVQFSSVLFKMLSKHGKAFMRFSLSLRGRFSYAAVVTVPVSVRVTMALSRLFMAACRPLPFSTAPSSRTIDGVMSLALCPLQVSQALQQFRSAETQATLSVALPTSSLVRVLEWFQKAVCPVFWDEAFVNMFLSVSVFCCKRNSNVYTIFTRTEIHP